MNVSMRSVFSTFKKFLAVLGFFVFLYGIQQAVELFANPELEFRGARIAIALATFVVSGLCIAGAVLLRHPFPRKRT